MFVLWLGKEFGSVGRSFGRGIVTSARDVCQTARCQRFTGANPRLGGTLGCCASRITPTAFSVSETDSTSWLSSWTYSALQVFCTVLCMYVHCSRKQRIPFSFQTSAPLLNWLVLLTFLNLAIWCQASSGLVMSLYRQASPT